MGRLSKRVINTKKTESKKKKQTMKKNLFKTRLLSFAAFCGFALAFASCANEDVAQSTTGTDNENDKNLTTFVAGDEAKTRTSMDYTSGDFFWEAGDKIWVKDDDGVWQQSSNAPTARVASFKYKVPGKFSRSNSYKVYYSGQGGYQDQVNISMSQSQAEPNSTLHFGVSGDCGTADASWSNAKNGFAFALDHQAAILVFQPYTSNTVVQGCFLTRIEVNSDDNIANTYILDPTTGELKGTGSSQQIVLTTKGSGSYANGFPLNTSSASLTTNGAYMLIKPGPHILKIRYWVKDMVSGVEGTVTKALSSFNYVKNTYYDMDGNLNVRDYDGDSYYMWDAKLQYWANWEWSKNLPGGQPTLISQAAGSNFPKSNSDLRWKNEGTALGRFDATYSGSSAPNVNEMVWYAREGDPRRDDTEIWTMMGHLFKGGLWIKKKAYISGFNDNTAPDGDDWRTTYKILSQSVSYTLPSTSEASQFFYLPAFGYYNAGKLNNTGTVLNYWSSSASPNNAFQAYRLGYGYGNIFVTGYLRDYGFRVQSFE